MPPQTIHFVRLKQAITLPFLNRRELPETYPKLVVAVHHNRKSLI